jgi:hypothetical protein
MNERIRELAEQAEMAANKGDHVDVKIMMEKFAELIVRECADLLETSLPYNPQQKMIKKHFGVEE